MNLEDNDDFLRSEDFDEDYQSDFDEWDEDSDNPLEFCCFDPRYEGDPNFCACREAALEEYKSLTLWQKVCLFVSSKWHFIKSKFETRKCYNCNKTSFSFRWNDFQCPKCKKEDLPF